jgi:hypothetical protein
MMKFVLASALIVATTPVLAAPANTNAAQTESGSGCIVSDGATYVFDPACSYHQVYKLDANGDVLSFSYQDKGDLQDGQTAPSSASRVVYTATYFGLSCTVSEVVTPSGQYSSNARC